MDPNSPRSAFWQGLRDCAPMAIVVGPFGMVFGVVAAAAGLDVWEIVTYTFVVFAGASQLAALQLMQDNAPLLITILSALAVNLRLAMYSAALVPHLGGLPLWQRAIVAFFTVDQSYALCNVKFEQRPEASLRWKLGYFAGTTVPTAPFWTLGTLVGALVGDAIPDWLPLGFAVPITFTALIAPALRTGAHRAAALVAVILSLVLAGLPFNTGLLAAGLAGMMTGARIELWQKERAQ